MSLSNRLEAFEDCLEYFERALADAAGLRVCFAEYQQAKLFQLRMHQARALQREQHKRLYEANDPRWGASLYDKLTVRAPVEDTGGEWWVYIERTTSVILDAQPIAGTPAEPNFEGST